MPTNDRCPDCPQATVSDPPEKHSYHCIAGLGPTCGCCFSCRCGSSKCPSPCRCGSSLSPKEAASYIETFANDIIRFAEGDTNYRTFVGPKSAEAMLIVCNEIKRLKEECHDKAHVLKSAMSDTFKYKTGIAVNQVAEFLEKLAND